MESKNVIEFLTNSGIKIEMIKENHKYKIMVTDSKEKTVKKRKVFESLNDKISTQQFFKICKYFGKYTK